MGCGVYWQQIKETDRAIGSLRLHLDIPGVSEATRELYSIRGQLLARVGIKYPRIITKILKLIGLSPGTVTLWHDVESGWMTEARARPGAPPVYKAASDEVALVILKREVTHELEAQLLTPDPYLGE